jgi:hypothetical protein
MESERISWSVCYVSLITKCQFLNPPRADYYYTLVQEVVLALLCNFMKQVLWPVRKQD